MSDSFQVYMLQIISHDALFMNLEILNDKYSIAWFVYIPSQQSLWKDICKFGML
jgi:hypothetical protein